MCWMTNFVRLNLENKSIDNLVCILLFELFQNSCFHFFDDFHWKKSVQFPWLLQNLQTKRENNLNTNFPDWKRCRTRGNSGPLKFPSLCRPRGNSWNGWQANRSQDVPLLLMHFWGDKRVWTRQHIFANNQSVPPPPADYLASQFFQPRLATSACVFWLVALSTISAQIPIRSWRDPTNMKM